MANPKGFEGVVSRPLSLLDPSEFKALLMVGSSYEGRGRRGVAMAHAPKEMEISDDEIRLQSRLNPRGIRIEEVPAPVAEDDEKFVSVLETGDFRPLQFVTGMEALKDGAPARHREKLPVVNVRRRGYSLRYAD